MYIIPYFSGFVKLWMHFRLWKRRGAGSENKYTIFAYMLQFAYLFVIMKETSEAGEKFAVHFGEQKHVFVSRRNAAEWSML